MPIRFSRVTRDLSSVPTTENPSLNRARLLIAGLVVSVGLTGCRGEMESLTPPIPQTALAIASSTLITPISTAPLPSSTPVPTESAVALPFAEPRASTHRFMFIYSTDTTQSVYLYDHELAEAVAIYELSPEISLHRQEEPDVAPSIARRLEPLPAGLPPEWMKLSSDGTALVTLQPAVGGLPNYVHQIDLLSGEILSIRILENYEWTFPTVAGRTPELGPPGAGEELLPENASEVVQDISWAPDGSGFSFVLRTRTSDAFEFDRFQLYYVARDSHEVLALGSAAPGSSVGQDPSWSPNGQMISYLGELETAGIWIVDLQRADQARRIVEGYIQPFYEWSADGRRILFEDILSSPGGEPIWALFEVDPIGGETQELLRVVQQSDERVSLVPRGSLPIGGGLLIREPHSVTKDPGGQDPKYEYSAERSKTYLLGASGIQELGLLADEFRPSFAISPTDDWIVLSLEGTGTCLIMTVPAEEVVYGPDQQLCSVGTWSLDGHLLLGRNDDEDFIIFDLDTQQLTVVAPELDGSKALFYGWVPDPSVYDEVVARMAP